jgi:hypothetical protein
MPRISAFNGIVISMNFGDHDPPHFHARYGEHRASFGIDPIRLLQGYLPSIAASQMLEWAGMHQAELAANWERARRLRPVQPIAPLA